MRKSFYNPDFTDIFGHIDEFVDELEQSAKGIVKTLQRGTFSVDDSDNSMIFTDVVPGISRENLSISVTGLRLTISGSEGERRYEKFIDIAEIVAIEKITAELKNGILTVKFPVVVPKESEPVKIEIQ